MTDEQKTDPDIVDRLRYTHVEQTMREAADEIERLRQGLWDCARLAGEDLDGDDTPDHLVYPELVVFAHDAVRKLAEGHGYLADEVDRLEAEIDRLRGLITAWADACDLMMKVGTLDTTTPAGRAAGEALFELRKAVGR